MKEIKITKSKVAIVDDDDYERICLHKWYYYKGYAARCVRADGRQHHFFMHREVVSPVSGMECDHVNGNKLDNRKENLRLCHHFENCRNVPARKNNKSGFKGVGYHKASGKWRAYITVNRKYVSLGLFDNPELAAKSYDKAAKKYFGSFSLLNFPEEK